jgi:predicted translin family RNA/ssDNA-binding protein
VLIGVLPVLGWIGVEAFHAAHDGHLAIIEVKQSRRNSVLLSCREANERHKTAQAGLESLAAKTNPKHPTLAQAKARKQVLNEFVEALAPQYDCDKRVRELTRP